MTSRPYLVVIAITVLFPRHTGVDTGTGTRQRQDDDRVRYTHTRT